MIDIYLGENYNTDYLSTIMNIIKTSASRELSYGFNNKEADVNIEDMKYEGDVMHVYGTMSMDYPGCIIICITSEETKVIYGGNFLTGTGLSQEVREKF
ncbi:terminal repeat-encoded protein [Staphylococcus phage VB-SavM-JYL02]|uniref:Terminal repeat-encoded protein n=2 Tax=Kayvirus P108 TaxID=1924731 RepID=A0A3T0IDR9_9CAUD|nr:hypothetical protein VBSavMJYL01_161 [Staphylococcus phage VB_SavM_JYL01]AZU97569.1 terminal repeat-encoded protein [Staphylococcus phage VB-SavM-JYL02]